ncbi:MAG: LysR family transcriptional regulator [Pseudomonadota bacterium]
MSQLNSDHLRTFLAIEQAGSVTGGADRIGRSQSATSMQIRQLEEVVGKPLFERHGRGVVLTAAGELLRPVARQVVQSLDRTLADLRGESLTGRLRIGMPDDHGRSVLTGIVADFASLHPKVELEVQCALGVGFESALISGTLDVAVFDAEKPHKGQEVLRESALVWRGRRDRDFDLADPLPVALFDRSCWWRDIALSSLEASERSFEVVFTSESSVGIRAAVESGIAVGLLSTEEDLADLAPVGGLADRHPTFLVLQRGVGGVGPVCDAMSETIRRAFRV